MITKAKKMQSKSAWLNEGRLLKSNAVPITYRTIIKDGKKIKYGVYAIDQTEMVGRWKMRYGISNAAIDHILGICG